MKNGITSFIQVDQFIYLQILIRGLIKMSTNNENNRKAIIYKAIIAAFALPILAYLGSISLTVYSSMDFASFHEECFKFVNRTMIEAFVNTFLVFVVGFIFFYIAFYAKKKKSLRSLSRSVMLFCTILIVLLAETWISVNNSPHIADQYNVWYAAKCLHENSTVPTQISEYFGACPHQSSMAIFMSWLMDLFHSSNPNIFKQWNVFCLASIVPGLCLLTKEITEKEETVLPTAILTLLFIPLIFYSS